MSKSFNRKWLLAIVVIVSILVVSGYYYLKSQKKDSSDFPTIKVAYSAQNLDSAPLIIAYEKGFFQDQEINVELVQATGAEATVAIGAGQVDLAVISAPRVFGAIENGAPVKMLSPLSNTDSQLFARPDSGINTIKDLEGKKVSYGPSGGVKELFIKNVINKEDVDISKITFVAVENAYLPVALMDMKTVDVILVSDAHYVDVAEELGAVILSEWEEKNYAKTTTGLTISANIDYLNNNEGNVKKFFEAMIEANRYLKDNLDDAAVTVTDFLRVATNGVMDTKAEDFAKLVEDGRVSYVLWEDTKDVLGMGELSQEAGNLKNIPTESNLYDLRFKPLLESAQNEIYGTKTN